jgi:threonine efflux protein
MIRPSASPGTADLDIAHTLGLLALAHLFAVMSPGPNMALVIQTAARSRRNGFLVVAGLWPAGMIYALAGLAGLGALLAAAPWLTSLLRLVCAGYLIWLGVRMILSSRKPMAAGQTPATGYFWQGFITNLTNPKSFVYFASIFGATGAFDLPLWAQAIIPFAMPSIGTLWYSSLAMIASSGAARRVLNEFSHWLDRLSGAIMIGFGVSLLAQR